MQFLPIPVSLGIEDHVFTVTGEDSLLEYSALLKELYPGSVPEVDALADEIRKVINDLKVLYGADNPLFSKSPKSLRMIPSVFAWLFKFVHTLSRIGKLNVPMEAFLQKIITHGPLRDVFSQHFFKGTPAFFTLSYFALYNDYLYPVGGVGAFTGRIREKIGELGGEVMTGTEIVKCSRARGSWKTAGEPVRLREADMGRGPERLYSIADTVTFLQRPGRGSKGEGEDPVLQRGRVGVHAYSSPSMSRGRGIPGSPRRTCSIPPRGRDWAKPSSPTEEHPRHWGTITKEQVFGWLDEFCDLNTFEVSIPVLRDPARRPRGDRASSSAAHGLRAVREDRGGGLVRGSQDPDRDRIIEVFSRTIFPSLKDKLISRFSASPLTLAGAGRLRDRSWVVLSCAILPAASSRWALR